MGPKEGSGSTTSLACSEQALRVSAEYQGLSTGIEPQQPDLVKLEAGMKPRPVRAEQELASSGAPNRLLQVIEPPYPGRICIHIGQSHELIDHGLVGTPVIEKAPEVRDDEGHTRISRGEHLDCPRLPADVDQHRQPVVAGCVAQLAGRRRLAAMHLDPLQTECHGLRARAPTRPRSLRGCTHANPVRRFGSRRTSAAIARFAAELSPGNVGMITV